MFQLDCNGAGRSVEFRSQSGAPFQYNLLTMPRQRETLLSYLEALQAREAEAAFVQNQGWRRLRWSYRHLFEAAGQWADVLADHGVAKGDRVLIWGENSAHWVAAFYGCLLRGAVVVPLDAQSAPDFVERVQQQVEGKLLLAGRNLRSKLPEKHPPLLFLQELEHAPVRSSGLLTEAIEPSDLVEIIFTSGTTAEPRGICLTHQNLIANLLPLESEIRKYLKWERWFHPLRFLNLVPLSHVFGQFMGIFVPQLLAGEVYFHHSLNATEIIEAVNQNRISVVVAVPRLLDTLREKLEREMAGSDKLLMEKPDSRKPPSFLRRVWKFRSVHHRFGWKFWAFVSGGATLNPETEAFWRGLGYAVVQGYGMTETAALVSVAHPFKLRPRSIGKALPGRDIRLAESGEVLVRGENVAAGIWEHGVKSLVDAEGWLHTGDMAERDEEGHFYFRGRRKDVIVTASGVNIYPEDLEAALNRQPEVRASAVIGLEGAAGPEPAAVLILKSPSIDPAVVVERANQALGPLQQMRRWMLWPEAEFPRTSTHKIQKPAINRWAASQAAGNQGTPQPSARNGRPSFVALVARITGIPPEKADYSARLDIDLKLDSVGRLELLSAVEDHYQIELDEASFVAAKTLGEIEELICGQLRGTLALSRLAAGSGSASTEDLSRTDREPAEGSSTGIADALAGATGGRPVEQVRYPYPRWTLSRIASWIRILFLYVFTLPVTRLFCRVRVNGFDRVRALSGPLLIVANHVTYFDAGLVLFALPGALKRRLAIAMDGERLRDWRYPPKAVPVLKRLGRQFLYFFSACFFNVFPLPQTSAFRRSFSYAGEALDRGYSVLIFPEGRLTEDGNIGAFRPGIGLLAAGTSVAVLPVRLEGLYELRQVWTRGQILYPLLRRGDVGVTFGDPLPVDPDGDPAVLTRRLEEAVSQLRA